MNQLYTNVTSPNGGIYMQIPFTKRKTHYLYASFVLLSLLLAGVSHARAQETTDPHAGMPMMDHGSMRPNTDMPNMRARSLPEAQQNRFINLVRNVSGRMESAIARLEGIATRILARAESMKASGINVESAVVPLYEARSKLIEAKVKLARAQANAEAGLVSDAPRERFLKAREEFSTVGQLIREAFTLLRQTITELRNARSTGSTTEETVNIESEPVMQ